MGPYSDVLEGVFNGRTLGNSKKLLWHFRGNMGKNNKKEATCNNLHVKCLRGVDYPRAALYYATPMMTITGEEEGGDGFNSINFCGFGMAEAWSM